MSRESTHGCADLASGTFDFESFFTTTRERLPDPALFPDLAGADGIWTEDFWRAHELANLYTDFQAARVLAEVESSGKRSLPDRARCREWLAAKRSASVFAGRDPNAAFGERLRSLMLASDAALAPALDLCDLAAAGYPSFLSGERSGEEILFAPNTVALWERYFDTTNPVYQPANVLAACAAREALANDGTRPIGRRLRVLEVGAGCGSGTVTLLSHLGPEISRLTASDISPNFLRKARERIGAAPGAEGIALELRLLDLDRPFETWKVAPASCDLVLAVNVLHSVRDLVGTLQGLRRTLAEGGHLVLGECIRPGPGRPVHPEFVFQLLESFRGVRREPFREHPGFLDAPGWRAALAAAGFPRVRLVPDFERIAGLYPQYSLGAVVGSE